MAERSGDPYKKRKVKKHREHRERRAHFGALVQIDGSHHDWFEGRGPVCVFMGYIDDATNTVHGRFYDYEGTMPAMDSMKRYIKRYGIPKSVYLDKHTTYKSWAEPTIEEELNDQKPMSHFEKSLAASRSKSSMPIHPRQKAGSSGSLRPSRTGSSERCVLWGSKASKRQMSFLQPICRSTTGSSRNLLFRTPICIGRHPQQRARPHTLHQRRADGQERLYHRP